MNKDKLKLYGMALVACVTLGLAPFPMKPEPHILEKLNMLFSGSLNKPIDIFDLLMHGAPWGFFIYLGIRDLISLVQGKKTEGA